MKIKLISIAMIVAISAGFNVNAADISDTSKSAEKSEFKRDHKRHKMKSRVGKIVHEYMLEQGDITQGEIDILKAEREANRDALKALRKAGDTEGLAAKKAELKAKHVKRRAEIKKYIESHENLKTLVAEQRQKAKKKCKERKGNRKERRSEA